MTKAIGRNTRGESHDIVSMVAIAIVSLVLVAAVITLIVAMNYLRTPHPYSFPVALHLQASRLVPLT